MNGKIARNSVFGTIVLFTFSVLLMPLFLTGCGGEGKSAKTLNVKVLTVDGQTINEAVFSQMVQKFATAHSGLVVSCSTEKLPPSIPDGNLLNYFGNCDVAVFPSVMNKELRSELNQFYPIQNIDVSFPPMLNKAYAGTTESSYWAVPLFLDPLMMVVKKNGINDTYIPSDWQTAYMRAQMMDRPLPYFVYITGDTYGLADTIALQEFSAGFLTEAIHNTPPEAGVRESDKLGIYARYLSNMKNMMIGTVEKRLDEIPQVKDLNAFFESDAYVTIARYSEYEKLPENIRNLLALRLIPQSGKPVSVCSAAGAGIPINSANPELADEFIRFLIGQSDEIAIQHNCLAAQLSTGKDKGIGMFKRETAFIIREWNEVLSDKVVIDSINGDLGIAEFNQLWRPAFFVPSKEL